ncbi:MAG: hypothetical protein PUG87_00130 [Eubacteriales bacterium]|nr:hypothetical protein [Clostridiales bacterium]MDD7300337.1 hypothetical protein [Eubacteriales bacterium]
MNVIFSNLDLILAALAILITVAVLARRGQIGLIRELVLSLVVNAEKEYGAKTGPIKKSDVTAKIYSMLPTASKLLISSGTVSDLIEEAKERMDETLPKNEEK